MLRAKKLAFMAICDDASEDTRVSYPGLNKVMKWSGLTKSAAQAVIRELRREGYIYRLGGGYSGRRTEYLVFPTSAEVTALDAFLGAVDNSEKKGAALSAQQVLKGAEKLGKGAGGSAPPLNTPLIDLTKSPSVDNHRGRRAQPRGDGGIDQQQRLGPIGNLRRRRLRRELDTDRLAELVEGLYADFPVDERPRLLLAQAYQVLGYPAGKGIRVTDPTAYVATAMNRDRPAWAKRAHQLFDLT